MKPVKIMIVEDESIVALDLKMRLNRIGYFVAAIASSGEEAIKRSAEIQPDLILMDVRLRGEMDGIETAQKIQKGLSSTKIIYLTAMADTDTLRRMEGTVSFGHILKPFDEAELRITIEQALQT